MTARRKTRPELPAIPFPCGCIARGGIYSGSFFCAKAISLWDKVAIANHNVTQTRKAVETWVRPYSYYAEARIKVREALYEYRHAAYQEHFGIDTTPIYRRVKRSLARLHR